MLSTLEFRVRDTTVSVPIADVRRSRAQLDEVVQSSTGLQPVKDAVLAIERTMTAHQEALRVVAEFLGACSDSVDHARRAISRIVEQAVDLIHHDSVRYHGTNIDDIVAAARADVTDVVASAGSDLDRTTAPMLRRIAELLRQPAPEEVEPRSEGGKPSHGIGGVPDTDAAPEIPIDPRRDIRFPLLPPGLTELLGRPPSTASGSPATDRGSGPARSAETEDDRPGRVGPEPVADRRPTIPPGSQPPPEPALGASARSVDTPPTHVPDPQGVPVPELPPEPPGWASSAPAALSEPDRPAMQLDTVSAHPDRTPDHERNLPPHESALPSFEATASNTQIPLTPHDPHRTPLEWDPRLDPDGARTTPAPPDRGADIGSEATATTTPTGTGIGRATGAGRRPVRQDGPASPPGTSAQAPSAGPPRPDRTPVPTPVWAPAANPPPPLPIPSPPVSTPTQQAAVPVPGVAPSYESAPGNLDADLARALLGGVLAAVDPKMGLDWSVAVLRDERGAHVFLTSGEGRGWLPAGIRLPPWISLPWSSSETFGSIGAAWEAVRDPARILVEFAAVRETRTGSKLSAIVSSGNVAGIQPWCAGAVVAGPVPPSGEAMDLAAPNSGFVDRLDIAASSYRSAELDTVAGHRVGQRCTELAWEVHARFTSTVAEMDDEVAAVRAVRHRILTAQRTGRLSAGEWCDELVARDLALAASARMRRTDPAGMELGHIHVDPIEAEIVRTLTFERRCNELALLSASAAPSRQVLRDAIYAYSHIVDHPQFPSAPDPPADIPGLDAE